MGKTLFDKLWDRHVITGEEGQAQLLYVDLHMIHEVTTPQAFEGLRQAGRPSVVPKKPSQRWITTCLPKIFLPSLIWLQKSKWTRYVKTVEILGSNCVTMALPTKESSTWLAQKLA